MRDRVIVLAVDTTLAACSVAVVRDGHPLAACSEAMTRGHQERLAPMAADAMTEARLSFADLDRIVVTTGPGSFTGLRVGLAFAKAMALALDVPCVGVGTLEALAANAPSEAKRVAAVLDARRDHVYLQTFSGGTALMEPDLLTVEAAHSRITALGDRSETFMIGAGAHLLHDETDSGKALDNDPHQIDPLALARLGAGRAAPRSRPQPLYLRAPDARTLAERAALHTG